MPGVVKSLTVSGGRVTNATGGTVDTSDMTATGVTAGSYTSADITVDAAGRITAAANGAGGGGLPPDADYGDITVSGSGAVWTIDTGAVSLAQLADAPEFSVPARYSSGSGARSDIAAVAGDGAGILTFNDTSDALEWRQFPAPGGVLQTDGAEWSVGAISLAGGGTGASLTDPGADRILFWDDSAGAVDWLEAGTGLSISGTTISATAGAGLPADPNADRVLIWDDSAGSSVWADLGTGMSISGTTLGLNSVLQQASTWTPGAYHFPYWLDASTPSVVVGSFATLQLLDCADITAMRAVLELVYRVDLLELVSVPASAGAAGYAGQVAYDTGYLYVCVTTDTWKRVALSTW